MPRVQLKAAYPSGQFSLDDPTNISIFSREFVVAEGCMRNYLEPLCSSEVHSALIVQTDYVLTEIGSSSEDDDEEEGDIQNQ